MSVDNKQHLIYKHIELFLHLIEIYQIRIISRRIILVTQKHVEERLSKQIKQDVCSLLNFVKKKNCCR